MLSLIALAALAGCSLFNRAPSFSANPGWVIENIDQTFWSSTQPGEAYGNFWIYATDPDGANDIIYVSVTDPNGVEWVLQDSSKSISHYNSTKGYYGGWLRCYTTASPHVVQLGTYDVLVKDTAKHEVHQSLIATAPGSATNSTGFVYDQSYTGSPVGGTAMLDKAGVSVLSNNGATISVTFTVSDSRTFNGYIWFYDSAGTYVAGTDFFSSSPGLITAGGSVKTIGVKTATVHASDLLDLTRPLGDIHGVHVVLTDGVQYYPANPTSYDHRSISAYMYF
jgi:hypothetical protein